MMPVGVELEDGEIPMDHQIDYKQKYKGLKKKLKFLVYEQECFLEELRKAQRRLLKISRDRSFLLDRLLQYEKVEESSGDSDATASSDSDTEGHKNGSATKKKRLGHTPGLPFGTDPSILFSGFGIPAFAQGAHLTPGGTDGPKKKKSSGKKNTKSTTKGKASGEKGKQSGSQQMTREELERHLDSRQNTFGIEKTPMSLPMDIFSNENSNPDRWVSATSNSDSEMDMKEDGESSLVIDSSQ